MRDIDPAEWAERFIGGAVLLGIVLILLSLSGLTIRVLRWAFSG